jgi:hypothetical protein
MVAHYDDAGVSGHTLFTTDLVILIILISYICSFTWPTEESMADHNASLGNGLGINAYQNMQPQHAQVLLG